MSSINPVATMRTRTVDSLTVVLLPAETAARARDGPAPRRSPSSPNARKWYGASEPARPHDTPIVARRTAHGPLLPGRGRHRVAAASAPAAVGARDDLQEVAARIFPVHAAPPVVRVDLTGAPACRVRPVRQSPRADATEDLVEAGLVHQERLVLRRDRPVVIGEVEGDAVVQMHDEERSEGRRPVEPEDLGEERGRFLFVPGRHDRVVQLDRHSGPLAVVPHLDPVRAPAAVADSVDLVRLPVYSPSQPVRTPRTPGGTRPGRGRAGPPAPGRRRPRPARRAVPARAAAQSRSGRSTPGRRRARTPPRPARPPSPAPPASTPSPRRRAAAPAPPPAGRVRTSRAPHRPPAPATPRHGRSCRRRRPRRRGRATGRRRRAARARSRPRSGGCAGGRRRHARAARRSRRRRQAPHSAGAWRRAKRSGRAGRQSSRRASATVAVAVLVP